MMSSEEYENKVPKCPRCGERLHQVFSHENGKMVAFAWAHDAPRGCRPTDWPIDAFKLVNGKWVKK